jgi:methylenetetrahydrofolate reductase (NADPH)
VDRFLFVYGDKPTAGGRTSELTVRTMIEEARGAAGDPVFAGCRPFRVGVTSGLRPVPAWKSAADFTFVQVSFSVDALLRWRESASLPGPVYAGVMVLASAGMARNLASTIPDIDIPAQRGVRANPGHPRQRCLRRRAPGARQPLPGGRSASGT